MKYALVDTETSKDYLTAYCGSKSHLYDLEIAWTTNKDKALSTIFPGIAVVDAEDLAKKLNIRLCCQEGFEHATGFRH